MTTTEPLTDNANDESVEIDPDLTAADVAWNLATLLDGATADELMDQADIIGAEIEAHRGTIATLDAARMAALLTTAARYEELLGRAGSFAGLEFAVDSLDPARGAETAHGLDHRVEQRKKRG